WMLAHDRTAALDAFDRALALSPSSLTTLNFGSVALAFMGETTLAIERAQLALRLSPMDPLRWCAHFAGRCGGTWCAARPAASSNHRTGFPRERRSVSDSTREHVTLAIRQFEDLLCSTILNSYPGSQAVLAVGGKLGGGVFWPVSRG